MADVRIILIMCLISTNLFAFSLAIIIYLIGRHEIKREFMRIFRKRGYMFIRLTDLNRQFNDIVIFPDKDIKNNILKLKGKTYIINPKHVYFGSRNIPCAYIDETRDKETLDKLNKKSKEKNPKKPKKNNIPWAYVDTERCSTLPLGSISKDDLPTPAALSRALELSNMAGALEKEKKRNFFVDIIPFIMLIGIVVLVWLAYQTNTTVSALAP